MLEFSLWCISSRFEHTDLWFWIWENMHANSQSSIRSIYGVSGCYIITQIWRECGAKHWQIWDPVGFFFFPPKSSTCTPVQLKCPVTHETEPGSMHLLWIISTCQKGTIIYSEALNVIYYWKTFRTRIGFETYYSYQSQCHYFFTCNERWCTNYSYAMSLRTGWKLQ